MADNTTAASGVKTDTNGHNGSVPRNGTGHNGTVAAEFITGRHWAELLDRADTDLISEARDDGKIGRDQWCELGIWLRAVDPAQERISAGTVAFAELPAVPRSVFGDLGADAPSRAHAAGYAEATGDGNPHDAGKRIKRERAQRYRQREATSKALAAANVKPGTEFTLEAVEAVAGENTARTITETTNRTNRLVWSQLSSTRAKAHPALYTAHELADTFGIAPELVAAMTPADAEAVVAAHEALAAQHRLYRKTGELTAERISDFIFTARDIPNQAALQPILGSLLHEGMTTELIAPPGGSKTFLAIGMALSVATGRQFSDIMVSRRQRVLYNAAEAAASFRLRVAGWLTAYDMKLSDLDDVFEFATEPINLTDPAIVRQLERRIERDGIGLVVFDTRAMVTPGVDENSATENGLVVQALQKFNRAGAAVLMVHHTAKGGDTDNGGRGNNAVFGAVYTSIGVTFSSRDLTSTLKLHKSKDGPTGQTFDVSLKTVTAAAAMVPPGTTDEQRSTLVPIPRDPFTRPSLTANEVTLLTVLAHNDRYSGLSRREITGIAGDALKESAAKRLIPQMRDNTGKYPLPQPAIRQLSKDTASTNRTDRYRLTDYGWTRCIEEGIITADYAEKHKYTADDIGSSQYDLAVRNIDTALRRLWTDGTILDPGPAMPETKMKKLVRSYLERVGGAFSDTAWSKAYTHWKNDLDYTDKAKNDAAVADEMPTPPE